MKKDVRVSISALGSTHTSQTANNAQRKRKWPIVLAIILLLAIIGSCTSGNQNDKSQSSATDTLSSAAVASNNEQLPSVADSQAVGQEADNSTAEAASKVAAFAISEERCVVEGSGDYKRLTILGTLTNNCDVPAKSVKVYYDIYGDDERRTTDWGVEPADEWELYYSALEPGESVQFKVSGEISARTNGVSSFEFNHMSCRFDASNEYDDTGTTGNVSRDESKQLVAEAKAEAGL